MKNMHILPTDKPSRLYLGNNGNFVFGMMQTSIQSKNDDFTNQNIYITSDEEIKDGDWMIRDNEQPIKVTRDFFWDFGVRYYKIILTTDEDLIKDGVQAIPIEFLQWFVRNPSCENVQVYEEHEGSTALVFSDYVLYIPKKELKQEANSIMKLGEDAFIKNVHEKLRETLSPNEKQMWINGYLLALTQQNENKK